ncbi:MAG: hypothetical protein PUE95_09980 [Lachnospiraceae bacterium]|nr:hypothetical protein [Lachnospiraceae bacterium]
MLWFTKLEQKYRKYAIPNLTFYLIICYAIGYLLQLASLYNPSMSSLMNYMTLDIYAILHGQIWRLFTWLLIPPGGFDLFTLVMLYCYFSIGTLLERTWGTFRYNVFMFMGFIFTVIGAVILYLFIWIFGQSFGAGILEGAELLKTVSAGYSPMFSTYYISMSIFLAFAMTFPDSQMLFMFVIPIKAKVLGIFYVAIMAYTIFSAFAANVFYGIVTATVILFSLFNVLVFFIVTRKSFRTPTQIKRQREFQKRAMRPKNITRHKCAICGRTEESDPDETFRFCSKCDGNYEYCSKHIYTHTHVKNEG